METSHCAVRMFFQQEGISGAKDRFLDVIHHTQNVVEVLGEEAQAAGYGIVRLLARVLSP